MGFSNGMAKAKKTGKTKFTCPQCGQNARGETGRGPHLQGYYEGGEKRYSLHEGLKIPPPEPFARQDRARISFTVVGGHYPTARTD